MPLAFVRVRDGESYPVEKVLSGEIEVDFPMSYVRAVCNERVWSGRPHVTALLTGAREQYLKHVSKYTLDLDGMAMAVAGTTLHANLEKHGDYVELPLALDEVQGTMDLLEELPNGDLRIVDYKLVGSFKLKKWLGIGSKLVPALDDFGNQIYLKSGPNKGKPKMVKEKSVNPENADRFDYTMQTNMYRVLIESLLNNPGFIKDFPEYEKFQGKKISEIRIFFVLRDGSIAHDFSHNTSFEKVEVLPDEKVQAFISERSAAITAAIEGWEESKSANPGMHPADRAKEFCPPMCSDRETWEGRKCEKYCPVFEACKRIGG
jgi:hypothetical protein